MDKVIVFGGSGFLGSHVADILTEKGFDVTIYDLKKSEHLKENQGMIVGDILDKDKVMKATKDTDYVYHFASIADIREAQDFPVEAVRHNVLGTVYILDACKEYKIKRFIYASSIYVYSEQGSFYRSSKQSSELFIENYQQIYSINYTILRYGSLYGKRANHFNFINDIINQALTEKKIVRKGDGNEIREYINVLDAARASVEILNEEYKNSYVMITGIQTMKVKDLLHMIKEIFNNKIEIIFNEEEKMEGHYEITPFSFKPRVAKKLILNCYHDLGEGILELIYDNYKKLLKDKVDNLNIELPKSKKS